MPKAHPPPGPPLKAQCRRDFVPEQGLDDWGLTPEQQDTYVELFRRHLVEKDPELWDPEKHDYYTLRRFLRARTYNLQLATEMWVNHIAWCADLDIDHLLQNFEFPERDEILKYFPQGYHKLDKQGRPVYVQLIGGLNIAQLKKVADEDRLFMFHLFEYERVCKVVLPFCSRLAGRQIETTFNIMDVKGMGLSQVTGEALRMFQRIAKADQDNFPEMLGHICIINAPAVFRLIWNMAKGFIDVRTQGKIEILGGNYKAELLKWIDEESLMTMFGGSSAGTLADDVGPWNDPELMASVGLDLEDLKHGIIPRPAAPIDRPYNLILQQQQKQEQVAPGAGAAPTSGAAGGFVVRDNPEFGADDHHQPRTSGGGHSGGLPAPRGMSTSAPRSTSTAGPAAAAAATATAAATAAVAGTATATAVANGPQGHGQLYRVLAAKQAVLRQQLAITQAGLKAAAAAATANGGRSASMVASARSTTAAAAAAVGPQVLGPAADEVLLDEEAPLGQGVGEGSVLHRMQVLERSLATMMEAQALTMQQLGSLAAAQREAAARQAAAAAQAAARAAAAPPPQAKCSCSIM
ncbi:hypothetical protein HXX76_005919 [Chlamydomonas incerta]|uniref:CRAL-TRIO domain-containing protein n=1 Tax=Chlamydomonas incerta TaxID=51695 RepID=A0A835TFE2_CHLIN|nr:hypothetical protein HXX76_005919 [Chlamydomonas incerta]|eukprot:KAG2437256.1 hypothetical protein HXX76_005919 [Chlamydomonas incerta]